MPNGRHKVTIWAKVKIEKVVFASGKTDAFAKVLEDVEKISGFEQAMSKRVIAEWEPQFIMEQANNNE